MKTFFLTMLMFVFLLSCTTGIQAQTGTSNLDQLKLMQQFFGPWRFDVGKDTVEVWETQQYGNGLVISVYHVIKGQETPLYINNIGFDSNEGKFKAFALWHNGDYLTWIGSFTTEKKFSIDVVQNFNPEVVNFKIELVYESPLNMTFTSYNKDGVKTGESKFYKVK